MSTTRTPETTPRTRRHSRATAVVCAAAVACISGTAGIGSASAATAVPSAAHAAVVAHNVFAMINAERKAHHLPALAMNTRLVSSAHKHNLDMARYDTMSHQLPGEAPLGNRITATGYRWNWAGENIGWNSDMSISGVEYLETIMYNEKPRTTTTARTSSTRTTRRSEWTSTRSAGRPSPSAAVRPTRVRR